MGERIVFKEKLTVILGFSIWDRYSNVFNLSITISLEIFSHMGLS